MLHVKSFAFNPFSENTYIIYNDEKEAFLIDPGNMPEAETQTLHSFIKTNELKVKNILLTHAHIDHIIGLQWAYDTFEVPVLIHFDEMEILERASFTAKNVGLISLVKPCSISDLPAIQRAATFANEVPIHFDTNGTVREARGLTSRIYTVLFLMAYCTFIKPITPSSFAMAMVCSRITSQIS